MAETCHKWPMPQHAINMPQMACIPKCSQTLAGNWIVLFKFAFLLFILASYAGNSLLHLLLGLVVWPPGFNTIGKVFLQDMEDGTQLGRYHGHHQATLHWPGPLHEEFNILASHWQCHYVWEMHPFHLFGRWSTMVLACPLEDCFLVVFMLVPIISLVQQFLVLGHVGHGHILATHGALAEHVHKWSACGLQLQKWSTIMVGDQIIWQRKLVALVINGNALGQCWYWGTFLPMVMLCHAARLEWCQQAWCKGGLAPTTFKPNKGGHVPT